MRTVANTPFAFLQEIAVYTSYSIQHVVGARCQRCQTTRHSFGRGLLARRPSRRIPLVPFSSGSSGGVGGGDSDALPSTLTLSQAYSLLGLDEGASYDAVLTAKNALLTRYQGQDEKKMEVELAYDIIFNSRLKARLSGDLPVSNKVRFADVAPTKRQVAAPQITKQLTFPQLNKNSVVSVKRLPHQTAISSSVAFAFLGAWTLVQGMGNAPYSSSTGADSVPGLQLALGTAIAVYSFREGKRVGLAKAFGLAGAGLLVGALLGGAFESWLRVDLVPIGSLSSPATVVSEIALIGLWASVFFLA